MTGLLGWGLLSSALAAAAAAGMVLVRRGHARRAAATGGNIPAAAGDWTEGGLPVEITGFDTREDVIALSFGPDDPPPNLSVLVDSRRGMATLFAGRHVVAVLRDAGPGFSLDHVRVDRQAA